MLKHRASAESFETAVNMGEGRAFVAPMDETDATDLVFSSQFACPHCGYAVAELGCFLQQPNRCLPNLRRIRGGRFFRPGPGRDEPSLSLPVVRSAAGTAPFFQMLKRWCRAGLITISHSKR